MNNSIKFTRDFIKVLFLVTLCSVPKKTSSDCGPSYDYFRGYSFLISSIIDPEAPAAFLPKFESLYETYGKQEVVQPRENVQEWWDRYCQKPKFEDIASLIYSSNIALLRRLLYAVQEPKTVLGGSLAQNTFAQYLKKNKCSETVIYLIYAKQCEPHVVPKAPWDDTPPNVNAMKDLIRAAREDFLQIKSHYIRLRYAYQMIRLAHYAGDYKQVIRLYEDLMPKIDFDPSIIEYWIMGHLAAAYLNEGRPVEAAYLYSKVFQNCASKRESAFQSFYIENDDQWDACMRMCKTDEERATLHVLRAYEDKSRALDEMQQIYALSPTDPNLEPLVVNEIKELEKDLLGVEFNDYRKENRDIFGYPRAYAGEYVISLTAFCKRLADEEKAERPPFWRMAQGYLEMIKGDNYASSRTFEEILPQIKDPILTEQLKVFLLSLKINSLSYLQYLKNPDSLEASIATINRQREIFESYRYFKDFFRDKLAYLYTRAGNPGKAFIMRHTIDELKYNPRIEILDSLIHITQKERPTRIEMDMVTGDEGMAGTRDDLLDIKATYLLSEFNITGALEAYKMMDDRSSWDNYGTFRPFFENFSECVYCSIPDTLQTFNKGELLEQLFNLDYRAKADPQNGAKLFYELGVAFYNMSYFGYSWKAMDYFRSGASLAPYWLRDGDNIMPYFETPFGNRENFNCAQALEYFDKAIQFGSDPEIKAKAMYMAAKCERNLYNVNQYSRDIQPNYYYFDLIERTSKGTQFYKDVISNCKTFVAYTSK